MSQPDPPSREPAAAAGSPAAGPPNRLLAASRVVHQLWRTQDRKVDLNRLLADESQRQSQELDRQKASHAALIEEWGSLGQALQES